MQTIEKYISIPLLLISFLVGIISGFFLYGFTVNLWHFSLSSDVAIQIDPINIFSTVITIILVVYVSRKLSIKDDGDKVERELLIGNLNTFETEFTNKIRSVSIDGVKLSHTANVLKRYGVRIQSLLKLAQEYSYINDKSETIQKLQEKMKEIRDLLTDTPKLGEVEDGVSVKDGKLYFSVKQVDKIADSLFSIQNLMFKLKVEVSRSRK